MQAFDKDTLLDYISLKQRELLYQSVGLSIDNDHSISLANSLRGAYKELDRLKKAIREDTVGAHIDRLKENLGSKS